MHKSLQDVRAFKDVLSRMSLSQCELVVAGSDCHIRDFSLHSNSVVPGDVFLGLAGKNANGGVFAEEALRRGAIFCVVDIEASRSLSIDALKRCIIVQDVNKALLELARYVRDRFEGTVIGITGSVGKTTTKEMLKNVLSSCTSCVVSATEGNQNNSLGVPLSMIRVNAESQFTIFEMGMNSEGEMKELTSIVRPQIAIVTNVNPVHIGNFRNLEHIAYAKAEIFESMQRDGVVVLNRDDNLYNVLVGCANERCLKIITFGAHSSSDVHMVECVLTSVGNARVVIEYCGRRISYIVHDSSSSVIYASLAVLAVAVACNVKLEMCLQSLQNFEALDGRGKMHLLANGVVLIDDSYSSSIIALLAALDKLYRHKRYKGGRAIAILGDMLEIGEYAEQFHLNVMEKVSDLGIDLLFSVGTEMQKNFLKMCDKIQGEAFANTQDLFQHVIERVVPQMVQNDVVLVKGSHAFGMDTIVRGMIKALGGDLDLK